MKFEKLKPNANITCDPYIYTAEDIKAFAKWAIKEGYRYCTLTSSSKVEELYYLNEKYFSMDEILKKWGERE